MHKEIKFDVDDVTSYISKKIIEMFILDSNNTEFIDGINNKSFIPNVLFENYKVEDVLNHPMGLWEAK